jgi:hypothetical protein
MATDAIPHRRPAVYPYSVRLTDEQETRMAEMRAAGQSASDVLREGFDLAYGLWIKCRE